MGATAKTEPLTGGEPVARRRHRSKLERRQIVEESLKPGTSVAVIARLHGVNANQVFHWRKLYREGRLDTMAATAQLMPVQIAEMVHEKPETCEPCFGAIHIELGRMRVRVEGRIDPETLRVVLEQMGR